MRINVLHHVTVKTDDLAATRDFYTTRWGLEFGRGRKRSALRLR